MKFLITLQQGENGNIIAECPALPGCVTQGKTREEVLKNIKEAIELSLETRKELGYPEPLEVAELDIAV
jgi:predicted RNase H-like HicB family nuclease